MMAENNPNISDENEKKGKGKEKRKGKGKYNAKKLFLRNLPSKTLGSDLEDFFSSVGPVKRAYVLTLPQSSDCTGNGIVQFALDQDAKKALEIIKKKKFLGALVVGTQSRRRTKRKSRKKTPAPQVSENNEDDMEMELENNKDEDDYDVEMNGISEKKTNKIVKDEEKEEEEEEEENVPSQREKVFDSKCIPKIQDSNYYKKKFGRFGIGILHVSNIHNAVQISNVCSKMVGFLELGGYCSTTKTLVMKFQSELDASNAVSEINQIFNINEKKSEKKQKKENKGKNMIFPFRFCDPVLDKARIICRNLPFKCNEQVLRKDFCSFGELIEIEIARKPNGEMRGFAFLQFSSQEEAKRACDGKNGKLMMGRKIFVSLAIPKDEYDNIPKDDEERILVAEMIEKSVDSLNKLRKQKDQDNDNESDNENENDNESNDKNKKGDSDFDRKKIINDGKDMEKRKLRNDEETSLFILNVPFDTNEEELSDFFAEFGSVRYCKLVMDPVMKHPKGTGFIHFHSSDSVDKLLQNAYPEMILEDTNEIPAKESLLVHRGIPLVFRRVVEKGSLSNVDRGGSQLGRIGGKEKEKEKPDKRNLHLLDVGKFSEELGQELGMSKNEISRRLRSIKERKQKLRDPCNFVSENRISIRNLPYHVDEKTLKKLVLEAFDKKHISKKKLLSQVKILREGNRMDFNSGQPRSKGFGFLQFVEHNDALHVIETCNNNAKWFGKDKRPIIEFSIENVKAIRQHERIRNFGKRKGNDDDQNNSMKNKKRKIRS